MEAEDDYVQRVMADMRRGLERWQRYVDACRERPREQVEREMVGEVVGEARRRGLPVVRGSMCAGVIVLECAAPAGVG